MDLGSINDQTKHIKDVRRIESELVDMSGEDVETRLRTTKENALIRWEGCHKSFKMLFIGINHGSNQLLHDFNVRLEKRSYGDEIVDTYARVWRSKDNNTYNVQPFTNNGSNILDYSFEKESFGEEFTYKYGTYHSKTAKLLVDHMGVDADINLVRIDGKLVEKMTTASSAVFLSALEGLVMPALENTEDTLNMIWGAVLDDDLNPQYAQKFRPGIDNVK